MRLRRAGSGPGLSVGIDLGTTFSAVARVNELGRPEVLPNREGESITPSVVLFDGEQPIVGSMAKRSILASPLDVVQFVKRSIGDPSWRFDTTGGSSYRPEEISALILKRLVKDAERALGAEVSDAVITVPAYFDDAPRRATIDAGTIAGLNVRRILNEPTAAALAYGIDGGVDGTVLVYDLGGGTFDVTAMRISSGEFRVLATHGDRNLGGFDFDNQLMQLLNERFMAAGGHDLLDDEVTEADLRDKAEIVKHTLTTVDRTLVSLSSGGSTSTIPVTRAEFDDACRGLLGRTRDIADQVVEEAKLHWHQVDRVLLAGGSTRMPMVRALLRRMSDGRIDASANPDEIVARGAAIQAALLDPPTAGSSGRMRARKPSRAFDANIQDVTSHGLGEVVLRAADSRHRNRVIIPRNTAIPARGSFEANTTDIRQAELWIRITQGDDEILDYVRIISDKRFPIPIYDRVARFETTLAYDVDQTVYVEIKDLTSSQIVGKFDIKGIANMSGADITSSSDRIRAIRVE